MEARISPALAAIESKASWKEAPASPDHLKALRTLATSSGRTFSVGITQGDAWRRIARATKQVTNPLRAQCAPPWYEEG